MYLHIRIVTAKPHTKITIVLLDKDFIFLEIITTPMLVFDTASKKDLAEIHLTCKSNCENSTILTIFLKT